MLQKVGKDVLKHTVDLMMVKKMMMINKYIFVIIGTAVITIS